MATLKNNVVWENPSSNSTAPALRAMIDNAAAALFDAGIASPRLDAEVLLSHAVHKDRAWLAAHMRDIIDYEAKQIFESAVRRRILREPLQYIIGKQEFWGLDFIVTPDVLIPRPETELSIEWAVKIAGQTTEQTTVVDLGTGSGCIAVSLATALKKVRLIATDKSANALNVARLNASNHGVANRILFLEGDLFQPLELLDFRHTVDIIVTNPPYVKLDDYSNLQPEVRDYEPKMALIGGVQGIEVHQAILKVAPDYLKPQGTLIMEMGIGQANALADTISSMSEYTNVVISRDLAGIQRVLIVKRS